MGNIESHIFYIDNGIRLLQDTDPTTAKYRNDEYYFNLYTSIDFHIESIEKFGDKPNE